jgi:RNA polymerase sigma factor (sigma-70 family)
MARGEGFSEQALSHVFIAHWRRFVRDAHAHLGSPDEAADAVSAAFTRALERRASFDAGRGSLATWMAAIVRHEVIDRLRRRARVSVTYLATTDDLASSEDVETTVEHHEGLARALTHLSERDRQLLALRFGQGLTNREIARLMGANERTVSVWLLRALRRLQPLIDPEGDAR